MSEGRRESVIRPREADIFLPNKHSEGRVLWNKISPEKLGEVLEVLLLKYPVASVSGVVKQSAQLEQRSNNFFVITDDTKAVLKKNIAIKEHAPLELTARLLEYLKSEGIPVQQLLPSRDKGLIVEHKNLLWQLFKFIHGDHYRGTTEELAEAADLIGKMHVIFKGLPYEFQKEIAAKPKLIKPWTEEGFQTMFSNAANPETPTDQLIADHKNFLEQQLVDLVQSSRLLTRGKIQVGKGTIHPHDFFFHEGMPTPNDRFFRERRLAAIIDFEETGIYELPRDIGTALHRLVRRYVEGRIIPRFFDNKPAQSWQQSLKEGVAVFLDHYRRQNTALTTEDISLISLYLRDELLRKLEHSAYFNPRYEGREETRASEAKNFISLLREADYIQQAVTEYLRNE